MKTCCLKAHVASSVLCFPCESPVLYLDVNEIDEMGCSTIQSYNRDPYLPTQYASSSYWNPEFTCGDNAVN